jgi:fused signal recognition particle receptor
MDTEKLKGLNPPPPGHNQPPEPLEPAVPKTLQEELAEKYVDLAKRIEEITALAEKAPLEVKDEETFAPLSDLLKAGRVALGMSESTRKIENEESRRRTAMIDAWFKNPAEKMTVALKAVKERTDAYLEDKKAKEAKRRADEAAAKAALAEAKRWDAMWADALAELAVHDARKAEALELAARLRKEAAARRADHLKNRGKRLAAVEPYLAKRAERRRLAIAAAAAALLKAAADERARLEAEGDHRLALEAEDKRRAEEAQRVAQAREKNDRALAEAKVETTQARRQEASAGKKAEALIEQSDAHADQADDLAGEAGRLGKRAERADRHANAGPADMSRTRTEMGTTASVSKSWKMISLDRNVVDLNLLRGFLHPDAVEVAARGYMMAHRNDAGGPKLDGAVFEQVEEGVYR